MFFSIFSVFVPAKVLHERFVQYFFVKYFTFLLDPPLCGPALLQAYAEVLTSASAVSGF